VKSNILGQCRLMGFRRPAAVANSEDGSRTDGLERQLLVIVTGMLPVMCSRLDKMCPDEIDERSHSAYGWRPFRTVFGIVLQYVTQFGQLPKVHPREEASYEEIHG